MPTAVLPVRCYYPLEHTIRRQSVIQDLGDGHEQRISKNQAYSRANGNGATTSYKGRNVFGINIRNMQHTSGSSTATANLLWAFYLLHGIETAFYFYNPAENTGDPGSSPLNLGIDVTGRYLVRFENENLSRTLFRRFLYNATINLIEVRE